VENTFIPFYLVIKRRDSSLPIVRDDKLDTIIVPIRTCIPVPLHWLMANKCTADFSDLFGIFVYLLKFAIKIRASIQLR
jgi:hypothetical protein